MSKPAARIGDMHMCPMVDPGPKPHVGGPILPAGCPTVLVGGQPAARVGDMAVCIGPPDAVAAGSPTVLIGGMMAARMGDNTAHGGVIVAGCPTVLIGGSAQSGALQAAAHSGAPFAERCAADTPVKKAQEDGADGKKDAEQKWSEDEIKKEWGKTEKGKEVLKGLPKSTKFKSYEAKPGDSRIARYSYEDDTIYIPSHYTSKQAAPTAAHEAVHANQFVTQGRPKSANDLVEMEVEAKNVGFDVYEQMGKPNVPYSYQRQLERRQKSQKESDEYWRNRYKERYGKAVYERVVKWRKGKTRISEK